jgi:HK97 family phage major capsid protein
MDIKTMSIDELIERRSAIAAELDADGADLDALEAEVRSINEELEARKAAEAKKAELRKAVANGAGTPIKTEERTSMTNAEVRNSKEYIEAFAKYIKTGKDTECRGLLTENVSGTVPVPDFVEGRIRTAWENDEIFSRVAKNFPQQTLLFILKVTLPARLKRS